MKTLICGSIAYDTIMVFGDRFKNHILPEQIHILNVAFLVPDMRREFGGCAGNIAYNLKLLGGEPLIMATIGDDSAPYLHRLKQLGLDATHVRDVPDSFTAQAFITTDLDDNQITAFHPGAMTQSHRNKVDGRAGREPGHHLARRPRRHAAACARIPRRRHSLRFRSGPGPADVQRRRTHGFPETCRLLHGQRLRSQAADGAHRTNAGTAGQRSRGADRHAGRQRIAHLCQGSPHRDSRCRRRKH